MKIVLTVLLLGFLGATVFSMARGFSIMGKEGKSLESNQFMTRRLWFQIASFVILALLLWIKR